ncbi:MAG TPA: 50S ribosomal protein L24 [Candidatus Omnitrophota bacterium]|nr:50S ribosomal protein L24 [Candidatus Omnitrophota bacterium]
MQNEKLKIKKGDQVMVLSGKEKGKKGKVLKALPDKLKVLVEGINLVKKHQKPSQKFQGGIIDKPVAISAAKVQVVCPRCGKPTRIKKEDGRRYCKKCKEPLDKE